MHPPTAVAPLSESSAPDPLTSFWGTGSTGHEAGSGPALTPWERPGHKALYPRLPLRRGSTPDSAARRSQQKPAPTPSAGTAQRLCRAAPRSPRAAITQHSSSPTPGTRCTLFPRPRKANSIPVLTQGKVKVD